MKYEISITYHSKPDADVKVFVDKQTDRQTGQKLYAPNLMMWGYKNLNWSKLNAFPNNITNTIEKFKFVCEGRKCGKRRKRWLPTFSAKTWGCVVKG